MKKLFNMLLILLFLVGCSKEEINEKELITEYVKNNDCLAYPFGHYDNDFIKAVKDAGGAGKQQLEITIYHKYEDGRTVIQKINQAQIDAGEVLLLT